MTEFVTVTFGDQNITVRKSEADRFMAMPWYTSEAKRPARLYSPAVFVAVPDPEKPLPNEENL